MKLKKMVTAAILGAALITTGLCLPSHATTTTNVRSEFEEQRTGCTMQSGSTVSTADKPRNAAQNLSVNAPTVVWIAITTAITTAADPN